MTYVQNMFHICLNNKNHINHEEKSKTTKTRCSWWWTQETTTKNNKDIKSNLRDLAQMKIRDQNWPRDWIQRWNPNFFYLICWVKDLIYYFSKMEPLIWVCSFMLSFFKDLSYHFSKCALHLFSCLLFTNKHYC